MVLGTLLKKIWENNTSNQILLNQRFINAYNKEFTKEDTGKVNVDLKNKNWFGQNGGAVKGKKYYRGDKIIEKSKAVQKYSANILAYYNVMRLLKKDIDIKTIKTNNYRVELAAKDLLDKSLLKSVKAHSINYIGMYEYYYVYFQMRRIRITFNKDFLPIEIEGLYRTNKRKPQTWHYFNSYYYSYNRQHQFDKAMNNYIELIKAHQFDGR